MSDNLTTTRRQDKKIRVNICPTCGKPYTSAKRCSCIEGQKPGEIVASHNATVLEDHEGNFAGWLDNDQEIVRWEE